MLLIFAFFLAAAFCTQNAAAAASFQTAKPEKNIIAEEIFLNSENTPSITPIKKINEKIQFRNSIKITPAKSGYLESQNPTYRPTEILPAITEVAFPEVTKEDNLPPEETKADRKTTEQPKQETPPEKKLDAKTLSQRLSKRIYESEYNYDRIEQEFAALNINGRGISDIYLIIWHDGNTSLPLRTIAAALGIEAKINRAEGFIIFQKPDTKETVKLDYKNNKIYSGSNLIEPTHPKMVFMSNQNDLSQPFREEVFVYREILDYLFDCSTAFSRIDYVLYLKTKNLKQENIQQDEEKTPQYEEELTVVEKSAKESKVFKLREIKYNTGGSKNYKNTSGEKTQTTNYNLNLSSSGNLLGGDYNIGSGAFYSDKVWELGNYVANLDYIGSNYESSLGTQSVRLSDLVVPSTNILGASFGTAGAVKNTHAVPRFITGRAENDTFVELFINDVFVDKQSVTNGRFQFESINYPLFTTYVYIRVEEVKPDNSRRIVYNRNFSKDDLILAPGQKEYIVFSGLDSSVLTNSFKIGGKKDNSREDTLKHLSGGKYSTALTNTLTAGVSFAQDYKLSEQSQINSSPSERPVTSRSTRNSSGFSSSVFVKNKLKEGLNLFSEGGFSKAASKSLIEPDSSDVGGFVTLDYENKKQNWGLLGKAYYYGPDFYTVSESGFIDKQGTEFNFKWLIDDINLSANYVSYFANLDKVNLGGLSEINNLNFNISGPTKTGQTLRFGVRSDNAKNKLFKTRQVNADVTINQKLYRNSSLNINFLRVFKQEDDFSEEAAQKDNNNQLNLELNLDIKKAGMLTISNQSINSTSEEILYYGSTTLTRLPNFRDLFIKLDRSAYPFKGITLSPNFIYRYGSDKGVSFGAEAGFRIKGLGRLVVRYLYNNSFSRFAGGNTPSPSVQAHTLTFLLDRNIDFMNIRAPISGNNTAFNPENAVVKGVVFLDINQNGVRDEGEKAIPDIDVGVKNMYVVKTDKLGRYVASNLTEQRQVIGIDRESLPVNYSSTSPNAVINTKRNKTYIANFGVIVTPGNISGKIEFVGKKQRELSDILLLLLDSSGKEVRYTTANPDGSYYFDFIPPGDYSVVIDKDYLSANALVMKNKAGASVNIPLVYDSYVDIENLNIELMDSLDDF